jgi:phosphate starvation-inducible PhoH-like protein
MEPWVTPFIQALQSYLGKGNTEELLKKGKIEIVPFEVVRGRTFEDAFVILDEAQNASVIEIKAFVSRHGENSVTVINGDLSQSDLNGGGNGLSYALDLIDKSKELKELVGVVDFSYEDIVRSDLCKAWVKAFDS